jgi:hypothetical protein
MAHNKVEMVDSQLVDGLRKLLAKIEEGSVRITQDKVSHAFIIIIEGDRRYTNISFRKVLQECIAAEEIRQFKQSK